MSGRIERDIERKVCKQAEREGWLALKLVCLGHRGFPDRWFIREGPTIVLIEFKKPGEKPRKLQRHVCKMLQKMGMNVHNGIDNYDDGMQALRTAPISGASAEGNDEAGESGVIS